MDELQKEVNQLQDILRQNPPDVIAHNVDVFFLVVMSIIIYCKLSIHDENKLNENDVYVQEIIKHKNVF